MEYYNLSYLGHGMDSSVYMNKGRIVKFWEKLQRGEVEKYFRLQNTFSSYVSNELLWKIDRIPWGIYIWDNLIREIRLRVLKLDISSIFDTYPEMILWDKEDNPIKICPKRFPYSVCSLSTCIEWNTFEDIPDSDSRRRMLSLLTDVVDESEVLWEIPEWLIAPINVKILYLNGWEIDLVMTDMAASVQDILG